MEMFAALMFTQTANGIENQKEYVNLFSIRCVSLL